MITNLTGETQIGLSARKSWFGHLIWALSAGVLGFIIAAVFSSILHLSRNIYLVPYFVITGSFLYIYLRWSHINVKGILYHHITWGLVGSVFTGFFTVQTILIQPSSQSPQGLELAFDLVWLGVTYGALDALLLSILPVFATWRAMEIIGWTKRWRGRIISGALSIAISLLVIALYHLGYPEFRGPQVAMIMAGVGVMSLAYLITSSPLTPILSHVAMHVTAVLYGINTVSQLPPHYYQQSIALILTWVTII